MYKAFTCLLIISFLLILVFIIPPSDGCSYCVANPQASDDLVQTKLDFACGQIPESCALVQPGGPCYVPNDVKATASYVFNDWFLGGSECDFEGAEVRTDDNPSHGNCIFKCR